MLDELPALAKRIAEFHRRHPGQGEGLAGLTAQRLVGAARAARVVLFFRVTSGHLTLDEIRSMEGRVNSLPLALLPGSPAGLVRLLRVQSGVDCGEGAEPQQPLAHLEYAPLGWPEGEGYGTADLNVLFAAGGGNRRELL